MGTYPITGTQLKQQREQLTVVPGRTQRISFRFGHNELSKDIFIQSGINPRYFVSGASILHLHEGSFRKRFTAQAPEGSYSFRYNPEIRQALFGKLAAIPNRLRRILLPENFREVTLVHEILHDLFFGGGLSIAQREDFFATTLSAFRSAVLITATKDKGSFFRSAASLCEKSPELAEIPIDYSDLSPLDDSMFRYFAAECFAYAGEKLLFPDQSEIGAVPNLLIGWFATHAIFSSRVIEQYRSFSRRPSPTQAA